MAETLLLKGLAAGTLVAHHTRTCHVDPIAVPAGCTASPRACCCSASSCPRLRLRRLVTKKVAWCRPGSTIARWLKAKCACSSSSHFPLAASSRVLSRLKHEPYTGRKTPTPPLPC